MAATAAPSTGAPPARSTTLGPIKAPRTTRPTTRASRPPRLSVATSPVTRRDRPGDHSAAPATGDEQVEQGRTPAVLGDNDDLAGLGRPLESHEVVMKTISAVTTRTGLKVQAMLDTNTYTRGIKISDREMKEFEARHLARHDFHGDWNYTITARSTQDATRPNERN
jgi:Rhodopirellula transposase DDE domain